MIRLFVSVDLVRGAEAAPRPEQIHYLAHVMRVRAGEEILTFNGRDGEWLTRVAAISRHEARLEAVRQVRTQAAGPDLDLLVALVKRPRLETIAEKAAELGVRRLRPLLTERTNVPAANLARLAAIAVEAAEQTGRLDVPRVAPPERLAAVLAAWPADRRLMFCDEAGDAPPILAALEDATPGSWAILIGPEGGFTSAERATARAVPGALPVSLGPRVLRADTAAIAALSLWQAALGDWRGA
ncbi:MAG TPA: 16S rRNA (uracil(1498)-N(3))-methyltransferase [Caulobacteraceae bacterium]|nr:16S rRNA (uracil(1498)-N(3))-methyltransferase [Caulobacteraceae bacterium]